MYLPCFSSCCKNTEQKPRLRVAVCISDGESIPLDKNYNLILTSHYVPEELDAVKTKIAYIETLLNIASDSSNANEFMDKAKKEYPNYSGLNYLEMTANFFFPLN